MRKKSLGIALIILPPVLLVLVISLYAVANFVISQNAEAGDSALAIARMINLALGIGGVVAVAGFLIGIPAGLFLVTRKEPNYLAELRMQPRFASLNDQDLHRVTKWSWGAFFSPVVWTLGNKLWTNFLMLFIPFWNLYIWIRLAVEGRKMVWSQTTYTLAQFEKRQKIIAIVIVILFALSFVFSLAAPMIVQSMIRSKITELAQETNTESTSEAVEIETTTPIVANENPSEPTSNNVSEECAGLADTDGDGLLNSYETDHYGTNPDVVDTDGDGYNDFDELKNGYNPNDALVQTDTDGDGLADGWETEFYLSKANLVDSDSDGVDDLTEIRAGNDPDGSGTMDDVIKKVQSVFRRLQNSCK